MAKKLAEQKKLFVCSHCDTQYSKWQGRCDECGQWGSLGQSAVVGPASAVIVAPAGSVVPLVDVKPLLTNRYVTGLGEFDRVLGGGIVPGSLVLLGGDAGVGKSTLVMQLAQFLAVSGRKVLYVSGEESAEQVKQRFDRVQSGPDSNKKQLLRLQFMHQEDIAVILATVKQEKPEIVIIDSIQTVYDTSLGVTPGNVNQIRACTGRLMEIAKKDGVAVMIIGHVTKDGALAGPKTLEHIVDTVVYMEGDRHHIYRLVRTVKNRFGSTAEVGVFDMRGSGLVEVKNPSLLWFSEAGSDVPGTVFSAVMEGSRVFLAEVQALVSPTVFGYPLRKSVGFDTNRLHILVAVLGTTISPYLFFWQTSQEVEEQIMDGKTTIRQRAEITTPADIKKMRIDVWSGMLLSNLVMFFIIAVCAATLFSQGLTTITDPAGAAAALKPLVGNAAYLFFTLGIIGTGLLAVPVLAGSSSYAISESFGWREGLYRKFKQAHAFYAVIIVSMAIGLVINFLNLDPVKMLIYSAVLNGLISPFILALIVMLSSNRKVMKEWTSHPFITSLGWLITGIMTLASIITIWYIIFA